MRDFFSAAMLPGALLVCPDCPISSIQEAIHRAEPGAMIEVRGGHYRETPIVIEKSIRLIGRDFPVIDARGQGNGVIVRHAPGIEIRGFEIRNTGVSYIEEYSGIRVGETEGCTIEGNRFANSAFGIHLEKSERCRIAENRFQGAGSSDSDSGNGIHVWYGGGHSIERNTIAGHRDGIYLEFVKDSRIIGNRVNGNFRYGLHFMSSNRNVYEGNDFTENGAGVAVMYSRDIEMRENRFARNSGPAAYGLLLKEIHGSVIESNEFEGNTIGIFMEGSNRSKFSRNLFQGNGVGLKVMADCESNEFERNNFIANSFDVTTNGTRSENRFDGNFWSHYEGYDLDRDGRGDQPFRPVSLSSMILERVDSAYVLLDSFLFRVLDQVERALPVLIPEALKDQHPSMGRIPEARRSHDQRE